MLFSSLFRAAARGSGLLKPRLGGSAAQPAGAGTSLMTCPE